MKQTFVLLVFYPVISQASWWGWNKKSGSTTAIPDSDATPTETGLTIQTPERDVSHESLNSWVQLSNSQNPGSPNAVISEEVGTPSSLPESVAFWYSTEESGIEKQKPHSVNVLGRPFGAYSLRTIRGGMHFPIIVPKSLSRTTPLDGEESKIEEID